MLHDCTAGQLVPLAEASHGGHSIYLSAVTVGGGLVKV